MFGGAIDLNCLITSFLRPNEKSLGRSFSLGDDGSKMKPIIPVGI